MIKHQKFWIQLLLIAGIWLLFISKVYAFQPFTIKKIKVEGLQRIEIGTVFNYLPVKVGDRLDDTLSDQIIERLYATGFFKDIRLENDNDTLIIEILERPIISDLTITGDHAFDHDQLIKSLKENGLSEGKIFEQSIIDQAVLGLKSEYYNRGLYSVVITPKVIELARNRVTINISIDEGEPAKIVDIEFVGASKFSQSKLIRQIFLSTGNWLSWWFKDNQYSSDKLAGDLETVRSFYLNQGYINFKINSVQVQLSPNKKNVYITANIFEGAQYRVKSVKLAGDNKNVPLSMLEDLIKIKPGQIVDQGAINKVADSIKTKVGEYGYAFASVNPIPDIDEKSKTVGYTFFVDTGKRVYVRRINISGNDKTRDVVIRRELRQSEDSLYNAAQIQRSKERLGLTGYFKNTDITTVPVPGSNDEVDMNVKVDENNTGSVNFGVGFAQGQGLLLNGSLSQTNLFGSGKSASLNAATSALNQSIGLSFNDPYFMSNGTNLGYDIYNTSYTPNRAGISPYSTQTLGAKIKTGVPVSEYDKINFGLGFENNQIDLYGNNVPLRFIQFTQQYGDSVNAVPFSVGWVRNTTDSSLWPTTGASYNQVADMTLPAVGAQYYRVTSRNSWYFPISDDFTWKTYAEAGLIDPYGNNDLVPFYQNYLQGGINSVRGYYIGSLGPKDTDGSSLGGTREVILTNELLFPMPGIKQAHTVRLGVFYDLGTVWGGNNFNLTPLQTLRGSYGPSLSWISPIGPIQVTYAIPMFNQDTDNLQPFQFQFGSSF